MSTAKSISLKSQISSNKRVT